MSVELLGGGEWVIKDWLKLTVSRGDFERQRESQPVNKGHLTAGSSRRRPG